MGKTRWWLLLLALSLVGAGVAWKRRGEAGASAGEAKGAGGAKGGAGAARVVPVVTAVVEKRDVPIFLEGLGNAVANRTVTIRPQVDGRLDRVLFREGQEVRKGALLAEIDPRPFQIQVHQAEGALARDQAQVQSAELDLKRYQDLVAKKLIAQQQVDAQLGLVGQLQGVLRVDQAQVESARLNLEYASIRAPLDGVTGIRQVDAGNIVHGSDPAGLVVIASLDPMAVVFTLPQDELAQVSRALAVGLDRAELQVEAFSRDGAQKLGTGTLVLIDNQINQASASIRLKAVFPNPQRALWPNQFVKARLLVSTRKEALLVPATAVQRGPEGTFAWVVGTEQTVSPRAIEVERLQGEQAILAKGLAPGEVVVIEGQGALRDKAKVSARQAGPVGQPGQKRQGPPKLEGRAIGAAP
jgi:multidrug efflux system membrane fusion protein